MNKDSNKHQNRRILYFRNFQIARARIHSNHNLHAEVRHAVWLARAEFNAVRRDQIFRVRESTRKKCLSQRI